MKSQTLDVNGITMRWEEQGEGMPLVLIHGIPTSPALWRHVVPRVQGAHCLAWEMVGYGESIAEGRDRDISMSHQADYLADWLKQMELGEVIVAGHDLGGGVAHIAAIRHPDLFKGLFLTNAIGYDSWPIPSVKMMQRAGGLIRHFPLSMLKQILRTLFIRGHDNSASAREALEVHLASYRRHGGAEALIRQVRALDVRDTLEVSDRLASLAIPARLAWGVDDQFQKIGYGERFARDLNAPLFRIEEGKHFTPEDHPDVVAGEINRLVEKVARIHHAPD